MTAVLTGRPPAYSSRREPRPVVAERREPVVWSDPAVPGPLDPDELDLYDRLGFLRFPALLEPGELGELRAEVRRLAADPALAATELVVREPTGDAVRSVFDVHEVSPVIARLVADERLAGRARQILGSDVYVHQSRVNLKPGFRGREFYWHSDFETWHVEDGMPSMRALSVSISLTENTATNGSLLVLPGSHRTFVGCVGETPEDHYKESLRSQELGTPDDRTLEQLVDEHGIEVVTGPPGSALLFDCNLMHGSSSNITPMPRSNVFIVFNSVENALVEPFGGTRPRPGFIAHRDVEPIAR